jgi:N utilization substance protein A
MNKEMFEALEDLSIEKGINKDYLLDAIEQALITAYKRNFNSQENVKIVIDEENNTIIDCEVHYYAMKIIEI